MSTNLPVPGSDTIERILEDELLDVLSRQAKRVPVPVLILDSIIAAYAARHLEPVYWVSWLAAVIAMQVVRVVVLTRLPGMSHLPHSKRLRIAASLSAINGTVHALSLFAFPYLTEFERAVQTMLLGGLTAGTVVSAAGYRPVYLSFSLPVFVPMFLLWAINAGGTGIGWENSLVAVLVILFGAVLYSNAKDSYKLFCDSFLIRIEQMRLNKQLSVALQKADAANKAKTRFLASASHDLRQPLHTLSLYGAALRNRLTDERSREIADHMKLALESLGTQLDALLDVSRLDAGVVKAQIGAVDLGQLLDRICNELVLTASEKTLDLTWQCPADVIVRTDETLLSRIVINLLSNAIKYTDAGAITIHVNDSSEAVILSIADTGQGIPADQQERVFEEFYQLGNPHRDRSAGFGLGLSIVKRMVELLNIGMRFDSAPGVGTTFFLSLPRVPAQQQRQEKRRSGPVAARVHAADEIQTFAMADPFVSAGRLTPGKRTVLYRRKSARPVDVLPSPDTEETLGSTDLLNLGDNAGVLPPEFTPLCAGLLSSGRGGFFGGLDILVVDDEAEVRSGMQTFLEGLGCNALLADGTAQAVEIVRASVPDLMLFDFRLRDGEDGLTMLATIRELAPNLPAIMISGDTAPDRLQEANAAGIELLHKPVSEETLRSAIAEACADAKRTNLRQRGDSAAPPG